MGWGASGSCAIPTKHVLNWRSPFIQGRPQKILLLLRQLSVITWMSPSICQYQIYHHSHPPNCSSQHIREYNCWPTMAHSVGFPCQKSRNPFFTNTHSFLPVHHQILSLQPPLLSRIHPFLIESLAFIFVLSPDA